MKAWILTNELQKEVVNIIELFGESIICKDEEGLGFCNKLGENILTKIYSLMHVNQSQSQTFEHIKKNGELIKQLLNEKVFRPHHETDQNKPKHSLQEIFDSSNAALESIIFILDDNQSK
jgi:hypothetical protein